MNKAEQIKLNNIYVENLPERLEEAFNKNDKKKIEEIIDFYYFTYNDLFDINDDDAFDKYYEDRYTMVEVIYKRIRKEGKISDKYFIKYEDINEDLLTLIEFPYLDKIFKSIDENFLKKESDTNPKESNSELLEYIITNYAEDIFYRYYYDRFNKELIDKQSIEFIEDRLKELEYIILAGYKINFSSESKNHINNLSYSELIKKFRGNPLKKRKNESEQKYTKVAQILKIAGDYFPQIKVTQKTACEIAGCNEFSFARWKNYGKNYDIVLKWQKELSKEIIDELKKEIKTYYRLHTEM